MKTKTNIFMLFLVIYFPLTSISQKYSLDAYEFPVKPGTQEWAQFETTYEIIDALEIPETILHNISTKGLVETCLTYPLLGDVLFFRTYQIGFKTVLERFNGYKEIMERSDAGDVLLDLYNKSINNDELIVQDSQFPRVFERFSIVMLLAQEEILNQFTEKEKILQCKMIAEDFKHNIETFGFIEKSSSCFLITRLLVSLNDVDFIEVLNKNLNYVDFVQQGANLYGKSLDDLLKISVEIVGVNYK